MTHADAIALLLSLPSVTWRSGAYGVKLWVHDALGRDCECYDGLDVLDCIEQFARKHERAKTLPPPRSEQPTLVDFKSLRGKP